MNLQQLRCVREIVRCGMSISEAAEALFTSQSGVSKQIKLFEQELGVAIFVRWGKRITALTELGQQILALAQNILVDVENIKRVVQENQSRQCGTLSVVTTHTQARYRLPEVVVRFMRAYPQVSLNLKQSSPKQAVRAVQMAEADFVIATEAVFGATGLIALPCYHWSHSLVVPKGHPLVEKGASCALEDVIQYPIITYDTAFTGRSVINQAFQARRLTPNVVLTALDADVIKAYVAQRLGVGIVASMACGDFLEAGLVALDAAHLFGSCTTYLGFSERAFLRDFWYDFIAFLAPQLDRQAVDASISQEKSL